MSHRAEEPLLEVAEAVADDSPVDWGQRSSDRPDLVPQLESLRRVAAVASAFRSVTHDPTPDLQEPLPGSGPAAPPEVLFRWGRLEVLDKLGEGSFGEVYRAYDPHLDLEVALKLRRHDPDGGRASPRSLLAEARRLARVRHPNVLVVHGADIHDGRVGIWSELVSGKTLEQWLEEHGPLGAQEATTVGLDLCRALAAVHAAGLIHGDLKAANVMRERGGRIILMDFGTVTEAAPDGGTAAAPATAGTPMAMAPELLRSEPPSVRSDIYALGALLYRLVTGSDPVEADSLSELRSKHERGEVRPLADLRADVPVPFARAIERALAPDPADRPGSAGAMERALAVVLPSVAPASRRRREPRASSGWPHRLSGLGWPLWAAIVVAGILLVGLAGHRYLQAPRAPVDGRPEIRHLAVLPFHSLDGTTGGLESDVLALGLTDALINRLSRLGRVHLRPTSAVLSAAAGRDALAAGRQLDVDAILEGRIHRDQGRVRVTVQLVTVRDGKPVWAGTFDRRSTDLFELEDSISEQLARALELELSEDEQRALHAPTTTDPEAYVAYLEGRYQVNRRETDAVTRSIQHFEDAIARDPAFAQAWAGLADAHVLLPRLQEAPPTEAYPKAREAALRALELDDLLAEAHASLGCVHFYYDWDWPAAEAEFRRALEIDPDYVPARLWLAELLSTTDRHDEAVRETRRALDSDPLSPVVQAVGGMVYLEAGRVAQATEQLERTVELDPYFPLTHDLLGQVYEEQARYDEAVEAWRRAYWLSGTPTAELEALDHAYARSGMEGYWKWRLAQLQAKAEHAYVPPAYFARVHAGLGDPETALAWLERAFQARDEYLLRVKEEAAFDVLRADPRFADLRQRLRLGADGPVRPSSPEERGGSTAAPAPLEVRAALFREDWEGPEELGSDASVTPGDRLFLELESPEPIYAYVLNEDLSGEAFLLFPLTGLETENPLVPGRRHRLPGKHAGVFADWRVTSDGGGEVLLVVAGRQPVEAIKRHLPAFASAAFGRPAELAAAAPEALTLRGVGGLARRGPGDRGLTQIPAIIRQLETERERGDVWYRSFRLAGRDRAVTGSEGPE